MKRPSLALRRPKLSRTAVGLLVVLLVGGGLTAALLKQQIVTLFSAGEHRTIEFTANHFLFTDVSAVKVAGVPVGVVASVDRADNGNATVDVKVDDDALAALGSAPSARIRPTTLLGGKYYIDMKPGGDRSKHWEQPVPTSRAKLPVEVDDIAEALQPDARKGASTSVRKLDETLGNGGTAALRRLLADAPGTLRPGGRVLDALRGDRPATDLRDVVAYLEQTSGTLNRQEGQLESILTGAGGTSSALGDTGRPMAEALNRLPDTLASSDVGLRRLQATLHKLRDTAGPARPAVRQLTPMLDHLDPLLVQARPVIVDLRTALHDARPLVRDLVPTSQGGAQVLNDLDGPVLNRVNGPIHRLVSTEYHGSGPYADTQGTSPFYRELGYMFSGLDKAGAYVDGNGHAVAFQPGIGLGSISAVGNLSIEKMFQHLINGGGR